MKGRHRAILYESMARLIDVGLGAEAIFSNLGRAYRKADIQRAVRQLEQPMLEGTPLSEALLAAPAELFPPHHGLAVRAAEISGHVPKILRQLAAEELSLDKARHAILSRSAYPILLLHMAVLGPNAGLAVTAPATFLVHVLSILIPLDLLLLLCFRCITSPPRSIGSATTLLRIPLLGPLLVARDYRAYLGTLHLLYEAGVELTKAAREALAGVENADLRQRIERSLEPMAQGSPFALAVAAFPEMEDEARGMLITAEPAGDLGPTLKRVAEFHAELEVTRRERLVKVAAGTLLTIALTYAAFRIISFYTGYFSALGQI